MSEPKTGVFPVYENAFKVGATSEAATAPADLETFSVSFDNGIETWNPMDQEGWQRALMTGKAMTITLNGKRNIGDNGNDYIASKYNVNGRNAEGYFCWTFPDGTKLEMEEAVFDVKNLGGGDSTNVGALEVDIHSNGKPTITPVA